MAEAKNGADAPANSLPQMKILGQFIRDLSFENIAAQKGGEGHVDPDIQVQVNLDARKRGEHQYDVSTKLKVEALNKSDKKPVFVLEIDYAGIFHIENIADEQLHPYLLIECPRMLFPFLRRIVSDVSRDGGFPPLNLENIDFVALYRQQLAKMAEAKSAEA